MAGLFLSLFNPFSHPRNFTFAIHFAFSLGGLSLNDYRHTGRRDCTSRCLSFCISSRRRKETDPMWKPLPILEDTQVWLILGVLVCGLYSDRLCNGREVRTSQTGSGIAAWFAIWAFLQFGGMPFTWVFPLVFRWLVQWDTAEKGASLSTREQSPVWCIEYLFVLLSNLLL